MITITALKWVPPFAQGQVRDLRARWALKEVGLAYEVRLIDRATQKSGAYRLRQPFGQVPVMEENGLTLFETGAIVLSVAARGSGLLPADPDRRALAVCWVFAALNSVEPALMNLAEVDFLMRDEELKARRRPGVLRMVERRLGELQAALGDRDYLVDAFSAADLMMASVLGIVRHTDILGRFPMLAAYQGRCEARPAFAQARAEQMASFTGDDPPAG